MNDPELNSYHQAAVILAAAIVVLGVLSMARARWVALLAAIAVAAVYIRYWIEVATS